MEKQMREIFVADEAAFGEQGRKVIASDELEIGVFKIGNEYYAWENNCPHQGGPICQGKIFKRVEEMVDAEQRSLGLRWVDEDIHIVCPWHGFEFNLRTGRHPGDHPTKLQGFKTRVEEGKVYVLIEE